jgi:hypothetical protein
MIDLLKAKGNLLYSVHTVVIEFTSTHLKDRIDNTATGVEGMFSKIKKVNMTIE